MILLASDESVEDQPMRGRGCNPEARFRIVQSKLKAMGLLYLRRGGRSYA
ncbi:MAG TPA: hypothetical protein VIL31_04680 [Cyclobacteriaceae bacterium]